MYIQLLESLMPHESACEHTSYSQDCQQQNQHLADEITRLAGHINAANYRFLKLVAEFDRSGGWAGQGIRSCAHWLSWQCGLEMNAAREKVRVSRKLEHLPKIDAAFATGKLSYSIVRAITRVAVPATESHYLYLAEWGTASQLEKLVKKHRQAQLMQDKSREQLEFENRKASVYQDDDGMWVVTARLPAVEGELVAKAIGAIVDREDDTRTSGAGPELHEKGATTEQIAKETFPRKRADALCKMAEHYLSSDSQLKDLKASERCQVMLHVDLKTLQSNSGKHSHDHNHCCVGDDNWVHPQVAKRLSCDASLVTVLKDEKGKVLNIGRRSRIIPPSIKRALDIRDRGCRFPGCECSRYVDAHHIRHWADGGETSMDNLVTLCRFHHRKLHEGEFNVKVHPKIADDFIFCDSKGDEIKAVASPLFPHQQDMGTARPSAEILDIEKYRPDVTAETCKTKWLGDSMDTPWTVNLIMETEMQGREDESSEAAPPG
jgi:hypothetical protein